MMISPSLSAPPRGGCGVKKRAIHRRAGTVCSTMDFEILSRGLCDDIEIFVNANLKQGRDESSLIKKDVVSKDELRDAQGVVSESEWNKFHPLFSKHDIDGDNENDSFAREIKNVGSSWTKSAENQGLGQNQSFTRKTSNYRPRQKSGFINSDSTSKLLSVPEHSVLTDEQLGISSLGAKNDRESFLQDKDAAKFHHVYDNLWLRVDTSAEDSNLPETSELDAGKGKATISPLKKAFAQVGFRMKKIQFRDSKRVAPWDE